MFASDMEQLVPSGEELLRESAVPVQRQRLATAGGADLTALAVYRSSDIAAVRRLIRIQTFALAVRAQICALREHLVASRWSALDALALCAFVVDSRVRRRR
ncbi:hypothetical protein ACGFIW_19350 [Micromonospora sp. NPDC048935]|uniref:hypothetical protein n=1 Tax=Micromonospora sp. NPDC048935 TaxID=3364262 RepID=UPI0037208820